MTAIDPHEILGEIDPKALPADAPPAIANYRDADVQGIACFFCSKFTTTGEKDGVPTGYCDQWEALASGAKVCDRFASGYPAYGPGGEEVWDFADTAETPIFNEIRLSGTDVAESEGFVVKEVLRTGEWPVIPTKGGLVKKPLRVVRDGLSDGKQGVIAMEELVRNFEAGAIANPQIPLSDDTDDHKNLTRVNTGFVRGLWIEDKDGGSVLKAKLEFTEPEVKEKVLRGTYADVSCGIPWRIRSRGQEFGATVEHVAITNRPFIDGLGPFLAASDQQVAEAEVIAYGEVPVIEPAEKPEAPVMSMQEILGKANGHLLATFSHDYKAIDVAGETVTVRNDVADTTWTVPFSVEPQEDGHALVTLAASKDWTLEEGETPEPSADSGTPTGPELSDLEKARRLRELRLSQPSTPTRGKETKMALSREELAALNLSDDARAAIQNVLDENARLSAKTREAEADRRVDELKELGLSERPGALKFYRQVFLSDDGGPAVVLSDSDGNEKSRLSALEILDQFIEGIKGADKKVVLSDQALASGNDLKPPEKSDTETEVPVTDRLAAAKASLYGTK